MILLHQDCQTSRSKCQFKLPAPKLADLEMEPAAIELDARTLWKNPIVTSKLPLSIPTLIANKMIEMIRF